MVMLKFNGSFESSNLVGVGFFARISQKKKKITV